MAREGRTRAPEPEIWAPGALDQQIRDNGPSWTGAPTARGSGTRSPSDPGPNLNLLFP